MEEVAIHVDKINKSFGEGNAKTQAVADVSFDAKFGELLYIVGPSGSGKTTLLSIISGILKPDSGDVIVENVDIWKLKADDLASFRLKNLGFVFQDFHLFPKLTTMENVAIPLILRSTPWDEALKTAEKYLEIVGLSDRSSLPPVKLSGGEQQRVAIARAMIGQPDILIFDEPTASLDGDTGRAILAFIKKNVLNNKRSIVIVTHDSRIYEFADRILKMEDGKLFREGESREK